MHKPTLELHWQIKPDHTVLYKRIQPAELSLVLRITLSRAGSTEPSPCSGDAGSQQVEPPGSKRGGSAGKRPSRSVRCDVLCWFMCSGQCLPRRVTATPWGAGCLSWTESNLNPSDCNNHVLTEFKTQNSSRSVAWFTEYLRDVLCTVILHFLAYIFILVTNIV